MAADTKTATEATTEGRLRAADLLVVTIAVTTWVDAWTHLLEDTTRGRDPLSPSADTAETVARAATEEATQ